MCFGFARGDAEEGGRECLAYVMIQPHMAAEAGAGCNKANRVNTSLLDEAAG